MSIFAKYLFCVFCISALSAISTPAVQASDVENQIETDRQILKRAQKQLSKGDMIASEATLRKLIDQKPDVLEANLLLSYVLLKQKRYFDSYNVTLKILNKEPKNAKALALMGFSFLNTGNFKEANLYFTASNKINKKESLAWEGSGLVDFYENRLAQSIAKLREATFLNSDEPDFFYTLAQVEARNENYKEAAAAYRGFLQIAPKTDTARREKIRGLVDFLEFLGNRTSLYDFGGSNRTTIPIDIVKQRPIMKVRIGKNRREYRFVLDTGSSVTVLSEETAKAVGIKPVAKGGKASAIGGTGKFDIVYGFLNSIEIGETRIRNVPIYIRKFHEDAEPVDGFIGLAVISRFLTTLDYEASTLTLVRTDENEVAKLFSENDLSIPLRLTTSGFLSGEVRIQGVDIPFYFIVDTGASISVISTELAGSIEISKFATEDKIRVVGAGGVLDEVQSYLLPKISFGSYSRENVAAVALNLNLINENSGFAQAGILGGNVLRNYRLTFDFKGSKIAFVPNKQ